MYQDLLAHQARIDELRREAERERLANEARRARKRDRDSDGRPTTGRRTRWVKAA